MAGTIRHEDGALVINWIVLMEGTNTPRSWHDCCFGRERTGHRSLNMWGLVLELATHFADLKPTHILNFNTNIYVNLILQSINLKILLSL